MVGAVEGVARHNQELLHGEEEERAPQRRDVVVADAGAHLLAAVAALFERVDYDVVQRGQGLAPDAADDRVELGLGGRHERARRVVKGADPLPEGLEAALHVLIAHFGRPDDRFEACRELGCDIAARRPRLEDRRDLVEALPNRGDALLAGLDEVRVVEERVSEVGRRLRARVRAAEVAKRAEDQESQHHGRKGVKKWSGLASRPPQLQAKRPWPWRPHQRARASRRVPPNRTIEMRTFLSRMERRAAAVTHTTSFTYSISTSQFRVLQLLIILPMPGERTSQFRASR